MRWKILSNEREVKRQKIKTVRVVPPFNMLGEKEKDGAVDKEMLKENWSVKNEKKY